MCDNVVECITEREVNKMEKTEYLYTNEYINFIRAIIEKEGVILADKANKLALKTKWINTECYSKAARIIVKAYLEQ